MPVAKHAEIVSHGGAILTLVDEQRAVEAVAVANGRIIAVGTRDDVMLTRGNATKVVGLAGKTLMPGFIDSHGHFIDRTC